MSWSQFWARMLAEGFPNDPAQAHAELDAAYESIAEDETQHGERDENA